VGEELSPDVVQDGLVWIVDPLDGTTNFLHDFPSYAVSIAAAVDGELQAAVVLQVPRQECYSAARGAGAWQGERRLSVSPIADPAFALIGTGFPFKDTSSLDEYVSQFARVAAETSGIRRPGSAALDLADVAAGRFDGFWEQRLSAWDIAAGSCWCVRRAAWSRILRDGGSVWSTRRSSRGTPRFIGGCSRSWVRARSEMANRLHRTGQSPCLPCFRGARFG
jgi:myo-inositol-1(or 4)-monophosphatase